MRYPDSLPCAIRSGYDLNHVSPLMRVDLESGRARQRRRFTSVPTMANVSWIMNDAEAQYFEAWFRDEIFDGALWFDMPLDSPIGMRDYECRFTDIYSGPTKTGNRLWQFSAVLEIRERPILPAGWGGFGDFILMQNIIDLAMNNEWPEA